MDKKNPVLSIVTTGYKWLILGGNLLQPLILLTFRLNWGRQFFTNGKGKLTDHQSIVEYFSSLHIPAPDLNAWFVGGVECFGGLLLLVGLASRPIALMLTTSMSVAYLADPDERAKVLNLFHDQDSFLQADPFFFWLTALLVLAFGPGRISVDALLQRFVFKKQAARSDEG